VPDCRVGVGEERGVDGKGGCVQNIFLTKTLINSLIRKLKAFKKQTIDFRISNAI